MGVLMWSGWRRRAVVFIIMTIIMSMLFTDPTPSGRQRPIPPPRAHRHEHLLSLRGAVFVIFAMIAMLSWLATVLWGSADLDSWPVLALLVAVAAVITFLIVPATKNR